ncbi:neuroendocrine convertase 1-like isoform X2 [Phymastichus coffea]|uniref:neuroendocrine convertase 1-like isoform X2 n=1 Tax=Phymastichus coffea TaxID=108790 RepID=UPI00273A7B70|nr:neuroendocrine convertase 1-like isoform X2 [Phymastichus coffea]
MNRLCRLGWLLLAYCCAASQRVNEEWVVRLEGGPQVAALLALQSGYQHLGPVLGFEDTYLWRASTTSAGPRSRRRGSARAFNRLRRRAKIAWADQQRPVRRHKRDYQPRAFNDELWDEEWYLQDRRQPRLDLNVLPVYRLGITGRGVRVAVIDDGLEYTHEDLRANYDPEISYDVNERDRDPIPRYEEPANGHGTRCAGEIAMEADNGKCGVGVAFGASVGGIKMLDGVVNDRVEAEALSYRRDIVDVYTASWGPPDDGRSLDAPGRLATEALERGAAEGRGGRGSIFVWASGNGGAKADDCACDGYVGSVYTLAIGSASQAGSFPWYGEICPATLAATYSSGAHQDQMIVTTDLQNSCTTSHTGTSASAPLAAGILALALQANANLTWRDVQHLVVYSSEHGPLSDNPGWFENAVGLWFNPRFGFGLMNAHALVSAGANWTSVPPKSVCQLGFAPPVDRQLAYARPRRLQFEVDACAVRYLEHVQLEASLEYSRRGALQIQLTAPTGTSVRLLGPRFNDNSSEGFARWTFMSVATWAEDPRGTWLLDIVDEVGPPSNEGRVTSARLILHGTRQPPRHLLAAHLDYDEAPRQRDDRLNWLSGAEASSPQAIDESAATNQTSGEDWLVRFLLSR